MRYLALKLAVFFSMFMLGLPVVLAMMIGGVYAAAGPAYYFFAVPAISIMILIGATSVPLYDALDNAGARWVPSVAVAMIAVLTMAILFN